MAGELVPVTLANIENGELVSRIEEVLSRALWDATQERPQIEKPRTVTVELIIMPVRVNGDNRAEIESKISTKGPGHRSLESTQVLSSQGTFMTYVYPQQTAIDNVTSIKKGAAQ